MAHDYLLQSMYKQYDHFYGLSWDHTRKIFGQTHLKRKVYLLKASWHNTWCFSPQWFFKGNCYALCSVSYSFIQILDLLPNGLLGFLVIANFVACFKHFLNWISFHCCSFEYYFYLSLLLSMNILNCLMSSFYFLDRLKVS